MASVAPAGVAAARAAAHRPILPGRIDPCPAHARRIITRSIANDLPSRLLRELDEDAREGRHPGAHVEPHVAAVIRQMCTTFLAAGESGRLPKPRELRVFRVLGERCGLSGPDCTEILETLEAAAEGIHILVLTHATRHDGTVGENAALAVGASLCGVIETTSRLVYDEFVLGFEAVTWWQPPAPTTVTALARLLDSPAEVADRVAPPDTYDVRIPRAVALLVSSVSGVAGSLAAACKEVAVLVPHAVALSPTGTMPLHGRAVVEYRSREDWRQARALIRATADLHGLFVVTTDPVIGFGRLREQYRRLRDAMAPRGGQPPEEPDEPPPGAPAVALPWSRGADVLAAAIPA